MMTREQSALTTLIAETLAGHDLARRDMFRRLLQAGLQDQINAEATVRIGAVSCERTQGRMKCRIITQEFGFTRSGSVSALISTIFARTTHEAVISQHHQVTDSLRGSFPTFTAKPDLTELPALPRGHWQKV